MSRVSVEDIARFRAQGSWRALESTAKRIAADVAQKTGRDFQPLFGGGSQLMLSLNHRISHDIDLFFTESLSAWNAILSPSIPDFGSSIRWAKKQLDTYLQHR